MITGQSIDYARWLLSTNLPLFFRFQTSGNERLQLSLSSVHSQLRRAWPDYQKPADARMLKAKFSLDDLLRAASVDVELNLFLSMLDLLN